MRNEQNASGVAGIKQQYQQQSTDNFRFNVELNERKVYNLLDIENIKESDPILYTMLKKNGAKQLFLYLIEIDGAGGHHVHHAQPAQLHGPDLTAPGHRPPA